MGLLKNEPYTYTVKEEMLGIGYLKVNQYFLHFPVYSKVKQFCLQLIKHAIAR